MNVAKLDDAARAGWLYYVAGNTQDEIARKLGVSRQSAQRMVSLAVREGLVKVRLDHPIAHCMELAARLSARYDLRSCEVVPSDPAAPGLVAGIAIAAAAEMERWLQAPEPRIIAMGTGRALRASVEELPRMDCSRHKIVSLLGNMMQDGSATPYNVVIRLAERVGARHYPMPLPVFAKDGAERAVLHAQEPVRNSMALCRASDVRFVGVGNLGPTAPLYVDGFIGLSRLQELQRAGAIGEITSRVYDRDGRVIDGLTNALSTSAPLEAAGERHIVGIAAGENKIAAIRAALRGQLVNALITDEASASAILAASQ